MISSYADVEEYLTQLYGTRHNPTVRLAIVADILTTLNNPQNSTPAIHIAGTSGKGSTAYWATALLRSAGYSVGTIVSPHVNTVAERSQVNGALLGELTYTRYFQEFVSLVAHHRWKLSYIEFLVVFSYWLFAKLELDYFVVEVGLGGRLDPTNTITRPQTVRVITDIGFDHVELLGGTLAAITSEKAGIIHDSDSVLIHRQPQAIVDVVQSAASAREAPLEIVRSDSLACSTLPSFQQRNLTLAFAAVQRRLLLDGQSPLTSEAPRAIEHLIIPGRFEIQNRNGVTVVFDSAHNPQKFRALIQGLHERFGTTSLDFIVALGENKQLLVDESLALLEKAAHTITFTDFTAKTSGEKRALSPVALAARMRNQASHNDNPFSALTKAITDAHQHHSVVVVTGSFYLIDKVR